MGRILIFVEPEGAKVYLNGEYKGDAPLDLEVPFGAYRVYVEKEGYISAETIANVTPAFPPEVELFLKPRGS